MLDCLRWQSRQAAGQEEGQRVAWLVVVSADTAGRDEFIKYVDSVWSRGLLGRIFVDECHTIITDVSYWERLGALKGLHRFGCLLVLLTATLSVRIERWF